MRKLAIYFNSCGPNVHFSNIKLLLDSIRDTIGINDFWFYIVIDNQEVASQTIEYCNGAHILEIVKPTNTLMDSFNIFYDKYINEFEYFMITQDDIVMKCNDWFKKTEDVVNLGKDKIGWITFTNTQLHHEGGSVTARSSWCIDRYGIDVCECRNWKNTHTLEYPKGPVCVFGPYSHLMFISQHALKLCGHGNNLDQPYMLLIDEDLSIRTLIKKLYNIWIPDLFYHHHRSFKSNLRYEKEAHHAFVKIWGFEHPPTDDEINNIILKRWPFLNYLCHKYSNDWIYLDQMLKGQI